MNEPRMPPVSATGATSQEATGAEDDANSDGAAGGIISITPAPTTATPEVINGATRSARDIPEP